MKYKVKVNCKNRIEVEGYVKDVKFQIEEKDGKKREVLSFIVFNNNIQNGVAYTTPIDVYVYKHRAVVVKEWIKEMMLVEVEGQLRLSKGGNYSIQGVYISDITPIMREIDL